MCTLGKCSHFEGHTLGYKNAHLRGVYLVSRNIFAPFIYIKLSPGSKVGSVFPHLILEVEWEVCDSIPPLLEVEWEVCGSIPPLLEVEWEVCDSIPPLLGRCEACVYGCGISHIEQVGEIP